MKKMVTTFYLAVYSRIWYHLVTEQTGEGSERYTRTHPLFSLGSSPILGLPAARGKTSLNARDWWKRKWIIIYLKVMHTIPTNTHSPSFSLCPVWGPISQERSRSSWFRLPAPSTQQKGALPKPSVPDLPRPHGPNSLAKPHGPWKDV